MSFALLCVGEPKSDVLRNSKQTAVERDEAGRNEGSKKRKGKRKRKRKKKTRTNEHRGLGRGAILHLKLGGTELVPIAEGILDEGAAEADDSDAAHDDKEGEPLVEVEPAVEKHDGEDADEEDEGAAGHLEDRDGRVEQADVHQLYCVACGWMDGCALCIAGRETREGREERKGRREGKGREGECQDLSVRFARTR